MFLCVFGSGFFSIFILNRFGGHFLKESSEYLRQNFISAFGTGALYMLLAPVAAFLMMIFVISFPFGVLICSIYCFSWLFAWPLSALLLTWWISERSVTEWSRIRMYLTAIGIYVVLMLVMWVIFLGWLANMILIAAVFGAIIQVMMRKMKQKKGIPQL